MERESFEDPEVAELLNNHFVSIKVDREERPDVDHIYMSFCQAMTGHGGWPMTIIMTPVQKPFFAGTYFPKRKRGGHPGLLDILEQIHTQWEENAARIEEASDKILGQMRPHLEHHTHGEADSALIETAMEGIRDQFDDAFGGFGSPPKFPIPHSLLLLLRVGWSTGDNDIIDMVDKTLECMYKGGIYDHVGFGFARYSTDREWLVPHFEKMLYDNALLALAYTEAFQVTGNTLYRQVVEDIFTYILRDMTDEAGGFYSAEDADSEGQEGKFYVWTVDEVVDVLGPERATRFCECYDITSDGNFEGANIPNLIHQDLASYASHSGVEVGALVQDLREDLKKLFEVRDGRVHPHKDDKVLTGWNGLMITALAYAGRVFGKPNYTEAAERALDFIVNNLTRGDGRLLARYRDGEVAHLGYADDYAFMIWGLIELYQANFDPSHLKRAVEWQRQMNDLFWDKENGGFYFYGSDGETLISRPKEIYDGATPSGNSVAALNLLRLARLTGITDFESLGHGLLQAFAGEVDTYPQGHTFFLMALWFSQTATKEMVIVTPSAAKMADQEGWLNRIQAAYLPNTVLLLKNEDDERTEQLNAVADFVQGHTSQNGKVTGYLCENFACQAPSTNLEDVYQQLMGRSQ